MRTERAWFLSAGEKSEGRMELIFLAGENQRAPNSQPSPLSKKKDASYQFK
jgi:hypothetical protein